MSDDLTPQLPLSSAAGSAPPRAGWYVHGAKTLRMHAKLTINKLASLADVSRDSVSNIETSKPVTELVAVKIFGALNEALGGKLSQDQHVKPAPPR